MIGFDLICLTSSTFSTYERMLRYANKILTPSELKQWVSQGENPLELWTYWGMKESAYKIEFRQSSLRSLCPKRFEVSFTDKQTACISSPDHTFRARIEQNEACLWIIAGSDDLQLSDMKAKVFSLSSSHRDIQSAEVRQRIRRDFPHASWDQSNSLPPFLSISHHGLWGGYAVYQQSVS